MTSDANVACADMTFADAVRDYALREGVPEAAVRREMIESGAYDALYDEETGLWATGPDAFIAFFEELRTARRDLLGARGARPSHPS